jgi:Zn-dependent M28 family amino/carboxypeptidase
MTCALSSCSAQKLPPSAFDGARAYADLERVVAIGPRVPGTQGSLEAQALIKDGLREAGVTVREFPFETLTPKGMLKMNTIVGVVKGTRDETIILSGHYDTKYFRDFRFVGANDGGSSTAWLLEMARVLGASREGCTVWLCFFDAEEAFATWSDLDSLYGSRELVKVLKETGEIDNIKAQVNVDMIGDCELGVFQDPGAPTWLKGAIRGTANTLGHDKKFLMWGSSIDDDHVPLRREGIDTINLIDFRYGRDTAIHNRTWHTAADTIDRVCPESLKVVGDVVYHALARMDAHIIGDKD